MKLELTDSFEKDVRRYKDKNLLKRLNSVLDLLEESFSLERIPNLKAMKGNSEFYRIRIGDFRLGFQLVGETVRLLAFGKRGDFYRSFP
ncbi:MAG: type II toxin-antitoxin system RelE/ParE family toxin [Candidatus Caenarcaniphilales bacterium]|nr:type II toxin-antitoxin system RelE/ParE family toxin [Candidatus Caenarcaniphilales bacterium]